MRRSPVLLCVLLVLSMVSTAPIASGASRSKTAEEVPASSFSGLYLGGGAPLASAPAEADLDYVPGEMIVRFRRDFALSSAGRATVHARAGGKTSRKLGRTSGLELVTLAEGVGVDEARAAYEAQGAVAYAEPNYRYHVAADQVQLVPDDGLYESLWGQHNVGQTGGTYDADIDAPAAWNLSTGSDEVIVAVVDTGIDHGHPDLDDNLWVNTLEQTGTAGVDDDGNGYVDDVFGWDFVNSDPDPMDDNGHGTHCSGTIGAEGDNGLGVAGVVWDVRIMGLKAFDAGGYGDADAEIAAIAYAADMGADVISCSWGGGSYSQALKDEMAAADAVVVCAAGNSYGNDNDRYPYYPASYEMDNLIAVAATDHDDALAGFSNFGATSVDLGAPGVDILSAKPGDLGYVYEDDLSSLDAWDVSTYTVAPWVLDTADYFSEPSALTHLDPAHNETAVAVTGPFDLSAGSVYLLWANYYWNLESGYDFFELQVSTDGANWATLAALIGTREGYLFASLSAYAGEPAVWVRYRIRTDASVPSEGVIIDDIGIQSDSAPRGGYESAYQYMSGTSMATPHVAGAAALLTAYDPSLTPVQVRDLLLQNVDPVGSLVGKVATGGRLNVSRAVQAAAGITPSADKVERVYGADRYASAVAAARRGFDGDEDAANGTQWDGVTDVVIASGEDRAAADPLAASGLCGAYDAPLFLVQGAAVPTEVKQAIKEIVGASGEDAVTIHVVGGPVSVPDARIGEIKTYVGAGDGLVSERILGKGGRYDLAGAIAKRMADLAGDPDAVLVANGEDPGKFFDALALSPIAAAKGYPILLVRADEVPDATASALDRIDGDVDADVIIAGGPNTVSSAVQGFFETRRDTERWYGSTRYATALDIANEAITRGWLADDFVGVAAKLPDALAGGSMIGRRDGVLVLTDGAELTPVTAAWLYAHRSGIAGCFVFGGPNSVTATVLDAIKSRVN